MRGCPDAEACPELVPRSHPAFGFTQFAETHIAAWQIGAETARWPKKRQSSFAMICGSPNGKKCPALIRSTSEFGIKPFARLANSSGTARSFQS